MSAVQLLGLRETVVTTREAEVDAMKFDDGLPVYWDRMAIEGLRIYAKQGRDKARRLRQAAIEEDELAARLEARVRTLEAASVVKREEERE